MTAPGAPHRRFRYQVPGLDPKQRAPCRDQVLRLARERLRRSRSRLRPRWSAGSGWTRRPPRFTPDFRRRWRPLVSVRPRSTWAPLRATPPQLTLTGGPLLGRSLKRFAACPAAAAPEHPDPGPPTREPGGVVEPKLDRPSPKRAAGPQPGRHSPGHFSGRRPGSRVRRSLDPSLAEARRLGRVPATSRPLRSSPRGPLSDGSVPDIRSRGPRPGNPPSLAAALSAARPGRARRPPPGTTALRRAGDPPDRATADAGEPPAPAA